MDLGDSSDRVGRETKETMERGPALDKIGADAGGERVDPTGSLPGSEPHVTTSGGHDRGRNGANADGGRVRTTIRFPQSDEPESVPTRGSIDDKGRGEADVDGREVNQAHSILYPDVEVEVGSGPSREKDIDGGEVERVDPSSSPIPILHNKEPDSTWT